jgi:hypothetical protein
LLTCYYIEATPPPSINVVQVNNTTAAPSPVEEWLKGMGLAQYWPAFSANGYDLMPIVAGLDEPTLIDLLGVDKQGHRRLLLMKVKEIVL